jgi:hypothetical protein
MGDHTTETLQQLMRRPSRLPSRHGEECTYDILKRPILDLHKRILSCLLTHVDCFVRQSRGNERVLFVNMHPYSYNGHDDEVWDKVGQAIGNLQALDCLRIFARDRTSGDHVDDQVLPNPDWKELARILNHMRQNIKIELGNSGLWTVAEVQALARAIRGHPTITSFDCCYNFPSETSDILYSALATLPALESIRLSSPPEDETTLADPESLPKVLLVPSLRSVYFGDVSFTPALCHATAKALMEGTAFTSLELHNCSFPTGECATIMANGLARNTSVSSIRVGWSNARAPSEALIAAALPSNVTLRHLTFSKLLTLSVASDNDPGVHIDWSPIFLALGKNTGLKTLKIDDFSLMDEPLYIVMKDGLGLNETLESLELQCVPLRDDNADLWCRALSFLRTNNSLKHLAVDIHHGATESCVSAFRIDIAGMLEENASLDTLSIRSWNASKVEDYVALVTSLQQNTTLKRLQMNYNERLLTTEEDKCIAKSLQKNYALESLPNFVSHIVNSRSGDVSAILRLNAAGRRYLIEDGSSVSKGVEVLSAVSSDINCVFLHLLENPTLCDRSAVEVASDRTEGSRESANPTPPSGNKRDKGQALEEGKESRRRLT